MSDPHDLLQSLLAESRTPGRFVERRAFTLSREKAIEKQREFALRHPRQYVLELVQAAVFAGATYLAIDTDPSALLVAWVGGKALGEREIESLFDYLFADRADLRWRHVVQLAIGVNALLQRAPKLVRIESGDGHTSVRMELDAEGHAAIGRSREPVNGTYVHVRHDLGWLARFRNTGPADERRLIEERCLYTPLPILLNGQAPFGYHGTRRVAVFAARAAEHFDADGRHGVVAAPADARGPLGFRMVVGGVWISTLPLAELSSRPLFGVVCDDGLRKTADQSDIVRDHGYIRMLHALQPVATNLLSSVEGPGYRPPALPLLREEARPEAATRPVVAAHEPVPEMVPLLGRPRLRLADLGRRRGAPLFWATPAHARELATFSVERFPWPVLLLTEGQVKSLQAQLPGLDPMRITSDADLEFVRRVIERRSRTHAVTVPTEDGHVQLQLHAEGPLPDWGAGVPFCVVGPKGVVEHGGIEDRVVRRADGRYRELTAPLHLPRVSLVLHHRRAHVLEESHVRAALGAAWRLAEHGDGAFVGAVVAALGVPQLSRGPDGVTVELSLPEEGAPSLRRARLAGSLTLDGFLRLLGTDGVHAVDELSALLGLDELEKRLGYGHLTHPSLAGRPLIGVGRFAERWIPLDAPEMWTSPALQQIAYVCATFADAPPALPGFDVGSRPSPVVAGAARGARAARPYDEAWTALFAVLQRVEAGRTWSTYARGPVSAGRVEGIGRLALLHLADLIGAQDLPLLVPTDGAGRRSLRELRGHPAIRYVARRGVRVAEPFTFAVTRDELRAIGDASAPLRYDERGEPPADHDGWLIREEVHEPSAAGGLRGWLGLRAPYDPSCAILLRTTGELVGLSDLERSVPCHGLLWTGDGRPRLSPEQRRHAQLAGLRLYRQLVGVLDEGGERQAAAARYATAYVLLVHQRAGALHGTPLELARRVTLSNGFRLHDWLALHPDARPPAPEFAELGAGLTAVPRSSDPTHRMAERLLDAIGATKLTLAITRTPHAPAGALAWVEGDSHRQRLVLGVNSESPAVRRALEREGPQREALLLELARQTCRWGADWGMPFDLLRAQEALLGQRYGA